MDRWLVKLKRWLRSCLAPIRASSATEVEPTLTAIVEGRLSREGRLLKALFVGSRQHFHHVNEMLFEGFGTCSLLHEVPLGGSSLRAFGKNGEPEPIPVSVAESLGCDLLILENAGTRPLPAGFVARVSPYVDMELDLKGQSGAPEKLLPRSMKSRYKRVARTGLVARTETDPNVYTRFFEEMHVPMVKTRHEGNEFIASLERCRPQGSRWFLLMASEGGKDVAAMEIHLPLTKQGQVRCVRTGFAAEVLADPVAYGELTTILYLNACQEAIRRGYSRINFGLTPAAANHGGLVFKSRWGARCRLLENAVRWDFWFAPGVAAEVLSQRPLLEPVGEGLRMLGSRQEGGRAERAAQDLVHAGLLPSRWIEEG